MGVLYSVQPLSSEVTEWLESEDIDYPESDISRLPTGEEIESVLASLEDFDVEYNRCQIGHIWQASVVSKQGGDDGPWTLINVSKYQGRMKENELWFEKGFPELIIDILHRLSFKTGPLVLVADTGESPIVVSQDSSVAEIINEWEHTNQL